MLNLETLEVTEMFHTDNPEQIDCVINHPEHGLIPYTADLNDPEESGRLMYAKLINGDYGEVQTPVVLVEEEAVV